MLIRNAASAAGVGSGWCGNAWQTCRRAIGLNLGVIACAALVACGGGGGGGGSSSGGSGGGTTTYTIGGAVSGLTGSGLVLQDNGGSNLTVSADGSFTFGAAIASGGSYSVTVLTQPSGPAQTCTVTDGSGTATANVTNVEVACTTPANTGSVWTWVGGSDLANELGTYGTIGTPAADNVPGGRYRAVSWTDTAGNFWLFSGSGEDSVGSDAGAGLLNDLWKYSGGQWTWMGGSNVAGQSGVYGTLGVAAAGNIPGARAAATSWTDSAGNFWLFGGVGYDSTGNEGELNDLWKYSGGQWTWVAGSNLANQNGTYGTVGKGAAGNTPGGRQHAASWIDASGNLWLFGGKGFDSSGTDGGDAYLNDLWEYTTAGQWVWMSGSNMANQLGVYGTLGTAAAANVPGARNVVAAWVDSAGALWLFGGNGYDSVGTEGGAAYLNDLWKYSAGQWTWMSGADVGNQVGTYGTQGEAASTNVPGARWGAASWIDASGNFWLLGGLGVTNSNGSTGEFSDLWEYSGGQWTWVGGPDTADGDGVYGTEGTAAAANNPGGRERGLTWTDKAGNVWLFGGLGYDSAGTDGNLNDLWKLGAQ
jgi:hypothetical protein